MVLLVELIAALRTEQLGLLRDRLDLLPAHRVYRRLLAFHAFSTACLERLFASARSITSNTYNKQQHR